MYFDCTVMRPNVYKNIGYIVADYCWAQAPQLEGKEILTRGLAPPPLLNTPTTTPLIETNPTPLHFELGQ